MEPVDHNPDLKALSDGELASLVEAAEQVQIARSALARAGLNVVGEILRGQGTFYEMQHYPEGDVFDEDSGSQYYYHAHRKGVAEHGHFHTFLRARSLPEPRDPAPGTQPADPWPVGEEAIAHLVAVSMDAWGDPIGLFTTNRWVTAESWYDAETLIPRLDRFCIDHARPNWAVNIWLTQLLRLYRHQIASLLCERDRKMAEAGGQQALLEDRSLEVLSSLPIDVDSWQHGLIEESRRRATA